MAGVVRGFVDLYRVLEGRGLSLQVLMINDDPASHLQLTKETEPFVEVRRHATNEGNAACILEGYSWVVRDADAVTVGGSCDADGEHDPLSFVRCIEWIDKDECDGVVGSIEYPEHLVTSVDQRADRDQARSIGFEQSALLGMVDAGRLYMQSPGFQLHRAILIEQALELAAAYRAAFIERFGEAPRWGTHFVMDFLLANLGARLRAAYLPCFGLPPNRTAAKRTQQGLASRQHMELLPSWVAGRR